MRRLLPVSIVLASLALAAPASALTPKDGTYKGTAKVKCPSGTCTMTATVKVKKAKITKASFKRSDGYSFAMPFDGKPGKVSSKGEFSAFTKTVSTRYRLKGTFSSATKLKASYSADSFDSTLQVPKFSFSAKKK
jgi:hypothetical protein